MVVQLTRRLAKPPADPISLDGAGHEFKNPVHLRPALKLITDFFAAHLLEPG